MSKYPKQFLSYEAANEAYGISREVLHVLRHRKHIPEHIIKKSGRYVYIDVNWFVRQSDYKLKARECAQRAVYFLEMFGDTTNAARIVANMFGGNVLSLAQQAHYDIFASQSESLTYLKWNSAIIKFFKIYRKIKARLNIAGLKFDDAFDDENYEKAKTVYDSLLVSEDVVSLKDFDKVEDYYDYFEARRHLENVRKKTTRAA